MINQKKGSQDLQLSQLYTNQLGQLGGITNDRVFRNRKLTIQVSRMTR